MESRNLIPVYRLAARSRRRRLQAWIIGGAVYATVLLAAYGVCRLMWSEDRTVLAADLTQIGAKINETGQTVRGLQRQEETQELALRANQALANQPDWSVLLAALPMKLGDDLVLRRCEIRPINTDPPKASGSGESVPATVQTGATTAYILKLSGYGRGMNSVLAFVQGLEGLGLFDQILLVRTSSEPFLSSAAIHFDVECMMGGPGGKGKG